VPPDRPRSSRRSPLRQLLKAGLILFTRLARGLERVSPRLDGLLREIVARAYDAQETRLLHETVVTMRVGEARFRLCLVRGHRVAHEYASLAQRDEPYEPLATACLTRALGGLPDPVFMDIGAFMGYFTCYAAALLRDRRPVFAVESNPVFCAAIEQSLALNGFRNATVLPAALADRPRPVTVSDAAVLPGDGAASRGAVVEAVTLDELCARNGIAPTVLKIDVHGAEGGVVGGMSRVCRESVQLVLLELHALALYGPHSPGVTRLGLLDALDGYGFASFHLAGHRGLRQTGMTGFFDQGRFAYVPVTPETRELLLFDRAQDVLIVASKDPELTRLLGPPIDLGTAVG
jgi:FkbM family methyltransferase